jgi:hypothetical protein
LKVGDWVHCGKYKVKDGRLISGKNVSVNISEIELKLAKNEKSLSDDSVLIKIERFSKQTVESGILKDGQKIGELIPRFNLIKDGQDWLSLCPNPLRWYKS